MLKNKERQWIMVRVRRTTHKRLTELARMWTDELDCNVRAHYNPESVGYSLDSVIAELVRRDDEHRARARMAIARQARTAGRDQS